MQPMSRVATQRATHGARTLARWLLSAEWRSHPARAAVAIVTIALGVALGFAVQLINSAAFNEFSAAARSLSGVADLQVRGRAQNPPGRARPAGARRAAYLRRSLVSASRHDARRGACQPGAGSRRHR